MYYEFVDFITIILLIYIFLCLYIIFFLVNLNIFYTDTDISLIKNSINLIFIKIFKSSYIYIHCKIHDKFNLNSKIYTRV